jgi:hypothetical protein
MVFDPTNPAEDLRQKREVADLLVRGGLDRYAANALAVLGGLPNTDGQALRLAAQGKVAGPSDFDRPCSLALSGVGRIISGSNRTVEEAFARMAALGLEGSPDPVAFHCIEDGCHARALPARTGSCWFISPRGGPPACARSRTTRSALWIGSC